MIELQAQQTCLTGGEIADLRLVYGSAFPEIDKI